MAQHYATIMATDARRKTLDECAAICRQIMQEQDAGAGKETPEERRDITNFALRWMRYGTAKQILERIAALPAP